MRGSWMWFSFYSTEIYGQTDESVGEAFIEGLNTTPKYQVPVVVPYS